MERLPREDLLWLGVRASSRAYLLWYKTPVLGSNPYILIAIRTFVKPKA
jgi:hypothetical protein